MDKETTNLIETEARRPFGVNAEHHEAKITSRRNALKEFYRILPGKLRPAFKQFLQDSNIRTLKAALKGKNGPTGRPLMTTFVEMFSNG